MSKTIPSVNGVHISEFLADPAQSLAPSTAASITVTTSNTFALKVRGTALMYYYFNSDSTKFYPLDPDVDNLIFVGSSRITQVVILNALGGTVYIQGR